MNYLLRNARRDRSRGARRWAPLALVLCGYYSEACGSNPAASEGNAGAGTLPTAGASGVGGGAGATAPATAGTSGGIAAGGSSGGSGPAGGATSGSGGTSAGNGGVATAAGTNSGGAAGLAGSTAGGASMGGSGGGAPLDPALTKALDIGPVWSGHPVGFALLTVGDRQFAAFYDAERRMTVAARRLDSATWEFARLATSVVWDSHNYIAMAADAEGQLHVSGNMHSSPLIYFRTARALDIQSFARVPQMLGQNEQSCTYPQFFHGSAGELVFGYRDGSSGNGNYIYNTYNAATKTWRRLLNSALMDGEGLMNAYPVGPIRGPDDFWHIVWVWRDTPNAEKNHHLSYARTRNLTAWETSTGRALTLPIRLASGDVVDPVPAGGGIINNNTKVGFDSQRRPIVAYHKYDAQGFTQLYNARLENGAWRIYQTSNWNYRWAFNGGGSLVFDIEIDPVVLQPDGTLTQSFYHVRLGRAAYRLDEATLRPLATIDPPRPYPKELDQPSSGTAGMTVQWATDSGQPAPTGAVYLLRWETLGFNRDQPRPTVPAPTQLRLYAFPRAP